MFTTENDKKDNIAAETRSHHADAGKKSQQGNPAWQTLALRPAAVQTKLEVSQPGDAYEQQADRVAEHVMRQSTTQPSITPLASHQTQPKCGEGAEAKPKVNRKAAAGNGAGVAPPIVRETLTSPGRQLDSDTRSLMENRFGHDFRSVRVHTDAQSAASARVVNSLAYTVGTDVVMGAGQYQPETDAGRRLLAHELTHVVQQNGEASRVQRQPQQGSSKVVDVTDPEDWKDQYMGYLLDDAVLADAVKYNEDVRRGNKKPDVGPEAIRQAQNFLGTGLMMPYDNGPQWPAILQQLSIDVATWQRRYTRNKDETYKTDPKLNVQVDGKLTPHTVAAMKINGLTPTDEEWAKKDRQEYADIRAEEEFYRKRVSYDPGSAGTVRQAIVDLAAGQAGKVYADDRGDASKFGWERIARYYEQAYAGTTKKGVEQGPDAYFAGQRDQSGVPQKGKDLDDIRKANIFLHDTDKEHKKQITIDQRKSSGHPMSAKEEDAFRAEPHVWNWSWCAIFAIWAVRAITGRGVWKSTGPEGLGPKISNDPQLKNAQRGDLLHIKDSKQNHHVVMAQEVPPDADPSTPITAVEGNLDAQEIAYSRRWKVSNIDFYYKTVPEGATTTAVTKIPTPPSGKK